MARVCGGCGRPVPTRWRNTRPPIVLEHVAGPIEDTREPRSPGFPWGRITDRRQGCLRCGRVLVRGRWAVFYDEGDQVLETGAGGRAPIMSPKLRHHPLALECEAVELWQVMPSEQLELPLP